MVTCSHVAVHLSICLHHRCTNVNKLNQQVWQLKCNSSLFRQEIACPPAPCGAETIIKESLKTKQKAEIVSVSVLSKVLSLD